MQRNISCIKKYRGEVENVCYMIYYHNGNTVVPVCCFTDKEKAIEYCKNNDMIQFKYTDIFEIPLNDSDYKF